MINSDAIIGRPIGSLDREIAAQRPAELNKVPAEIAGIDVQQLITVRTEQQVVDRRRRLIDHLWKGRGFPDRRPVVGTGVDCPDLRPLDAGRIDRSVLALPFRATATSYLVHPRRSSSTGRVAIFLSGHGDPRSPKYHRPQLAVMQELLDRGFSVASVDMPYFGWNREPSSTGYQRPPDGWPDHHEVLGEHESDGFSAARLFVEPAIALINEYAAGSSLTEVAVIGFSGGAWTTTLLAAIDPRVTFSCQVAGSCPFYLRPFPSWKPNFGDWEQRKESQPGLYAIAGYLDLYLLGGAGPGRRQLQILNRYDPTCFPGVGHRSYATQVAERAALLGGSWDALDDATHGLHQISPYAVSVIGWELDQLKEPA